VLLGYIALDVLSHIVGENPRIFDPDCADDGLGACFRPDDYFRPDASVVEMKRVKSKWRRLYRRGRVGYVKPQLWKQEIAKAPASGQT